MPWAYQPMGQRLTQVARSPRGTASWPLSRTCSSPPAPRTVVVIVVPGVPTAVGSPVSIPRAAQEAWRRFPATELAAVAAGRRSVAVARLAAVICSLEPVSLVAPLASIGCWTTTHNIPRSPLAPFSGLQKPRSEEVCVPCCKL